MIKQKITENFLYILNRLTKKHFLYITKNASNSQGQTAVKDIHGVWHVGNAYDSNDIVYGIAQNGFVEEFETKLVCSILSNLSAQSNVCFYDIGANIGYYGLLAATKYKAKTYSFEPTPLYAKNIKDAAYLNHVVEQVNVYTLALSNINGQNTFHQSGSGSSLEVNFNLKRNLPTITVTTTPLDDLFEIEKMTPPTFVKIDVEGHEWAVFQGAQKLFTKTTPVILLELCTTLRDIGRSYVNPHYTETIEFLEKNNYVIWYLTSEHTLLQWDHTKVINRAGMFLCLHKSNHDELIKIVTEIYPVQS
jgi:FkbM family methyltransferase